MYISAMAATFITPATASLPSLPTPPESPEPHADRALCLTPRTTTDVMIPPSASPASSVALPDDEVLVIYEDVPVKVLLQLITLPDEPEIVYEEIRLE